MNYQELKELVLHHSDLYYNKSAPIISDKEFDDYYDLLERMESLQGWVDYDSPTNKVGGQAGKVRHPIKLYSLRKVYEADEVDPAFTIKTPKIDGANLTLVYINSKLRRALTRGNGEFGEDVTVLAKEITNIPKRISTSQDTVIINGECVTDNTVDNFRNYVSGALGLKSVEEFKQRNIKFIAHDYLNFVADYTLRMSMVKQFGFVTVLDDNLAGYPTDGVVFRLNSYKESQSLGYTSKYPRFAIALKERGVNIVQTTLQDVEWSVGRTGTANPVGIVSPVVIDDAVISRVTLHNISIIEEAQLGIGDTIEIERAGGVIPKFVRVVEHAKHNLKITKEHAEKALGEELIRDSQKLLVRNKYASAESVNKQIEYFAKVMEIKGLGPATLAKMNFTSPVDIFTCTDWADLGANGAKIVDQIEMAKLKPYPQVLAALGIPGVGQAAAKLIVQKIPSFRNLRDIKTVDIKNVGPSTIESVINWLDENETWVYDLPVQLDFYIDANEAALYTKKVCITGKMDMTRPELTKLLESKGFKVATSVTKDCYALITGGDTTSTKYCKAVQAGIKVLDYWSNKNSILAGNF